MSLFDVTTPRYFTDPCFLAEEDRVLARSAANAIARNGTDESVHSLPPKVLEIVVDTLRMVAGGQAVTGMSLQMELNSQQAAELLGISDAFFRDLLDSNKIASRKVDGTLVVLLQDVLEYKQERKRRRLKAVDELVEESQQLGLY